MEWAPGSSRQATAGGAATRSIRRNPRRIDPILLGIYLVKTIDKVREINSWAAVDRLALIVMFSLKTSGALRSNPTAHTVGRRSLTTSGSMSNAPLDGRA
jgi:hypothetical protein